MNPDERAFELGRKNRAERPLVPSTLKGIGNFKAGTANRFLLQGNRIHQNLKILLRAATSLEGLSESNGNSLR